MRRYDVLLLELLRRLDEKADRLISLLEVRQDAEHGGHKPPKGDDFTEERPVDQAKVDGLHELREDASKQETRNLLRDHYLSWMAESNIEQMIREYHKRHFGLGAFLFYFGAAILAQIVCNICLV